MPSYYRVPLKPGAPQRLSVALGQVEYRLTLKYRDVEQGGWVLDIADANDAPIVSGVPLVTGADLLGQYKHLGFAGRLWVQTPSNPDAAPTFDGLGDALLWWVTE